MAEATANGSGGIDKTLVRAILQSSSTKKRITELDALDSRIASGGE